MKRLLTSSFLMATAAVFAQGIKFQETNFASLLAQAKKEKKVIFVDAYASWCGPCKLMAKNIFTLQSVGDYYNSHFVNTKIDMEKGEGVELAKKYGVKAYPTYLFIDGDGKVVHKTLGYFEEKEFLKIGEEAGDPSKQLGAQREAFNKGEKDPEFLKNLTNLTMFDDQKFAGEVYKRYMDTRADKTITKSDLGYIMNICRTEDNPLYSVFKSHKDEIAKLITEERYDSMDKSIQMATVSEKAYDKSTKKINDAYYLEEAIKLLGAEKAQKSLLLFKGSKASANGDKAGYAKYVMEAYSKDWQSLSSDQLNSLAWSF